MKSLLLASALALSYLSVSGAQAAINGPSATANIDWSGFNVAIFDLVPGGITPSLSFSSQSSSVSAYATTPYPSGIWSSSSSGSSDWIATLPAVATTPHAESSALSNAAGLLATATAESSVENCGWWCWSSNYGNSSGSRSASFTLSGAGVAVITVGYNLAVTDATPYDWVDYAGASVSLYGNYYTSDGSNSGSSSSGNSLSTSWNPSNSYSGIFALAVVNPSDLTTAVGSLSGSVSAYAQGSVMPVPEPETWAMLLAGIGLVGVMARKRISY